MSGRQGMAGYREPGAGAHQAVRTARPPYKDMPSSRSTWPDYQDQGEAEMTDLGNGIQQFKAWFQIASTSIRFGPISWHRSRSSGIR